MHYLTALNSRPTKLLWRSCFNFCPTRKCVRESSLLPPCDDCVTCREPIPTRVEQPVSLHRSWSRCVAPPPSQAEFSLSTAFSFARCCLLISNPSGNKQQVDLGPYCVVNKWHVRIWNAWGVQVKSAVATSTQLTWRGPISRWALNHDPLRACKEGLGWPYAVHTTALRSG